MKYSVRNLAEIFTYQRCAGSKIENEFISKYIDKVSGMRRDSFGNRFIKIGKTDTAFLSHTDTVHKGACGRQKVYIQEEWAYTTSGHPLGADDGTGVWLMLNMIADSFNGLYIFHRDEEAGGRGSQYILSKASKLLDGINKAVSLDRKGYKDVITHQGWSRCCSDKFAKALASQLGDYKPCDHGVFTDSANYVDIVPECTNLSIGYFNAHTEDELQDLSFAKKLFYKLKRVRWNSLPIERKPGEDTYKYEYKSYKPQMYRPNYGEWGYGNHWDYSWW